VAPGVELVPVDSAPPPPTKAPLAPGASEAISLPPAGVGS